jgi:hypothetical protein
MATRAGESHDRIVGWVGELGKGFGLGPQPTENLVQAVRDAIAEGEAVGQDYQGVVVVRLPSALSVQLVGESIERPRRLVVQT